MAQGQGILSKISALSISIFSIIKELGKMFWFFITTLANGLRGPFYIKQFGSQLVAMGYFAIPLITLTALFTGMVLALQTYTSFSRFGADTALPEVVALSITRELGPVLSALMMAGRWGASIAAELATMRVTDQLDALVSLSTHPQRYLVVPRILAAVLCLPFLCLIADVIGILGGYGVGVHYCHIHGPQYISKTLEVLLLSDVTSGLIKASCFGFIISFMGCYEGYHASRGAEGVGVSTTRGVVRSSILILLANYALTALFFSR